jgi:hypothetical protein
MSNLISALDMHTPSQIGENGSMEYTWSNEISERITQISFQLTRTRDENQISKLGFQISRLLIDIQSQYKRRILDREVYLEYMSIMYRMVGQTRDIIDGKGEYNLSYMLLSLWAEFNPKLAEFAFKQFLVSPKDNPNFHPYGSWKDIKYLYKEFNDIPLVDYGLSILLEQLREDVVSENPSLAAKWVPREKSQFSELFTKLAINYFSDYIVTAKTDSSRERAIRKAKTEFRKIISTINKKLDTVQIKQCNNTWSDIDPSKQTSITMNKQKKAFLNIDKHGNQRSELDDRIVCANRFKEFAEKASKGEVQVKGKRVGLNDFTKSALELLYLPNSDEINILNAQWLDNSKQTGALGKMIAMADVSGSMDGEPLCAAIALAIRIAEKSMLGKRVLTFSASPTWVNLEGHDNFVDMVKAVKVSDWGQNTNFYSALKMILDAIVLQKLKPEDVEDMVLTVLSDMQMDQSDPKYTSLMNTIETLYAEAGQKLWNKPFKVPHILFWNLRSTSGFPTLSTKLNCSMMSGFSPALLNLFCDEGINALQSCTPWSLLVKSLDNDRYSVLDQYIRDVL